MTEVKHHPIIQGNDIIFATSGLPIGLQNDKLAAYVGMIDPNRYTLFCQDQVREDQKLAALEDELTTIYGKPESHVLEKGSLPMVKSILTENLG